MITLFLFRITLLMILRKINAIKPTPNEHNQIPQSFKYNVHYRNIPAVVEKGYLMEYSLAFTVSQFIDDITTAQTIIYQ